MNFARRALVPIAVMVVVALGVVTVSQPSLAKTFAKVPIQANARATNECFFTKAVAERILGGVLIRRISASEGGTYCEYVTANLVLTLSYTASNDCTPNPGEYALIPVAAGECVTSASKVIWVSAYSGVGSGVNEIVRSLHSQPTREQSNAIKQFLIRGGISIVRLLDKFGGQG